MITSSLCDVTGSFYACNVCRVNSLMQHNPGMLETPALMVTGGGRAAHAVGSACGTAHGSGWLALPGVVEVASKCPSNSMM